MRTIYEKIEEKGKVEVDKILKDAKAEAKKIKENLINDAKVQADKRLKKATDDTNKQLTHKERLVDLEMKQALLTSKQKVLDEVFNEVLEMIIKLEGKDLLNFVANELSLHHLTGSETIYVSEKEYDKYLKALSSNKKGKLVDLDLLNAKLKTSYKLSDEIINLKYGFLVEGTDFDLNFSYDELVNNYRKHHEKEISKKLFD